ncbi:DUF2336 domain-containing protein [Ectorhizobium quercum]|uniref:DUF2336 domain-containing protein n=1 Tax=Ectorhizobium quercum TaxID=2965071 RepID=UPI003521BEE7
MIVQAFLRWAETAKAAERAAAAKALVRAYLQSTLFGEQRKAAMIAITHLLDDPSPVVRLGLAEALAVSAEAPRAIVLSLAQDQSEIAATVLASSPVLLDADLIDLIGRGDVCTRAAIAARTGLSAPVAAAVAEVGEPEVISVLLENGTARIGRISLRRMAERFAAEAAIRAALLERGDLPADARHILVAELGNALAELDLVRNVIGGLRMRRLTREICELAAVVIAGTAARDELPELVEHMRASGRLTPAFLMQALCAGRIEFFAEAIRNLSGLEERRVRSILATGRMHAVRALFESVGLARDVSVLFVEAVMLWREAGRSDDIKGESEIAATLVRRFRDRVPPHSTAGELLDIVERAEIDRQRRAARDYVGSMILEAA